MQLVTRVVTHAIWLAAAAFILAASAASAQTYPPEVGSVDATVEDPEPAPGSSVEVVGSAFDADGNPLAGVTVTFTITSNPGAASFANGSDTITAVTDANGEARVTLNTGATPGTIVVRVDANGTVSQVTVSTGGPQSLPNTGGDPGSPVAGMPLAALAIALATAALVLGGVAYGVRKVQRVIG